jgi:hypothetical protein
MLTLASAAALTAGVLVGSAQPDAAAAARDPQDRPANLRGATVSDDMRRAYAQYWASLPEKRASALEGRLQEIERRAARGENVERRIQLLRQQEPELARLSTDVLRWSGQPASKTGGKDIQASTVECSGIGWIGRDGQARCAGKYVNRKMVGRPK